MPTIVVLVKNVPDSWSKRTLNSDYTLHRGGVGEIIDEINEFAVEQALQIREANPDFRIVALSAGPDSAEEALRKALAMGADQAVLLADEALAGSDLLGTAWALTNAINTIADVQLIIAGKASSDATTGALPGIIAEYRQLPALISLSSVSVSDGTVTGTRVVQEGKYELSAPLPALISVNDQADKPRFPNFKGIMAAKKAEIERLTLADIGVEAEQVGLANAATSVQSATERPERTQGQLIKDTGEAGGAIADFLAQEKLI